MKGKLENHLKGEFFMKNLLVVILLVCGLYASADMHGMEREGYFTVHVGMDVASFDVKNVFGALGYGRNLMFQGSYSGFVELGLKGLNNIMLFVKYGYEFMEYSDFSFGLDTALLFGMAGVELGNIGDFDNLGFGNTLGVFAKTKISDSLSVLLRAGLKHDTAFDNVDSIMDNILPYVGVAARWYL